MKIEPIEVYSDATNQAVIRHPGRRFPGILIQGDTLHAIVISLRVVIKNAACLDQESQDRLGEVAQSLDALLAHYRAVLVAHHIDLPFQP